MKLVSAAFTGVIFAVGLTLSGMTQPLKVQAFLDIFGAWDPSLAFVMGGAIAINVILFRFILRKANPIFSEKFHMPTNTKIDFKLIFGSALFGVGWALAGYCPGPGLTSIFAGDLRAPIFVGAMAIGMYLFWRLRER